MNEPDYRLDLDRSRSQTLRQQAHSALIHAIRHHQPGFQIGDRLSASELARHNQIHRNTLSPVMEELVRAGYLRRQPNKGFEIIECNPERPPRLTKHVLSVSEVAHRNGLLSRSQLIQEACGIHRARELSPNEARVRRELNLGEDDTVSVLARARQIRPPKTGRWRLAAIEHSFIPTAQIPDFLSQARREIRRRGDFSVYRQLRRAFPNDDFFKAFYEISLLPLPQFFQPYWTSHQPPMTVLTVTYCSAGPTELTYTWFDATRAVLLAGSLDVNVVTP